jgi:hypothetical protein
MSLYPSLEDLKVDKVLKVKYSLMYENAMPLPFLILKVMFDAHGKTVRH